MVKTEFRRSSFLSTSSIGTSAMSGSHVPVARVADHGVALYQFTDAGIERNARLVAGRLNLGVGHDVVTLVGILADGRFDERKLGNLLLDDLAQLLLRDVGFRQSNVENLPVGLFEIVDAVQKRARDV